MAIPGHDALGSGDAGLYSAFRKNIEVRSHDQSSDSPCEEDFYYRGKVAETGNLHNNQKRKPNIIFFQAKRGASASHPPPWIRPCSSTMRGASAVLFVPSSVGHY